MKKIYQVMGGIALLILLVPQLSHTAYLFQKNSQDENYLLAWMYAIGVDLAILVFTLKGWIYVAVGYLAATLCTNIVYQFYPIGPEAKILLSVLLSSTIFIFSHLYRDEKKKEDESSQEKDILKQANKLGVSMEVNPYVCPSCGKSYATSKALNGHISTHKASKNPNEWTPDKYGNWEKANEERARFVKDNKEVISKILGKVA